ncbi:cytochrome P450 2A13-like [Alligator sinensis]|uniref:Cytochrome P450 2A13-like n=1 Tax=Alligator sinensis TaxID=38654 RepID=A0A1U8DMR3_ALLSI|nr:cytochrome P450 2A13-like [Alligator sinensis]
MDFLGAVALFLTIFLTCLILLSTWKQMQGRSKMPPGPTPLPLIGNLLQVDTSNMLKSLMKLSEKYGPVYTVQLGTRRVVVLCGYRAMKEALVDQGDEFGGRGKQATFDWLFQGYGVAFSNGERAKQLRRFSITTLRNFGVGKRSIEERILDEAQYLLGALRDTKGQQQQGFVLELPYAPPWTAPSLRDPGYRKPNPTYTNKLRNQDFCAGTAGSGDKSQLSTQSNTIPGPRLPLTMDFLGAVALFLTIFLTCLILLSTWKQMQGRSKMPPGPTPLPLIGNLLQVDTSNMLKSLMKLSEKYGPVYTVQLGTRRVVVLCGYRAMKEALVDQGDEFGGRGKQATFDWLFQGYGVAFSNGERAKQLRRFSITTLRNFGVGKRSIEERILDEAQYLLGALRDTKGLPFDPTYILSRTVSNVISSVVFGDRFDYKDKEFLSLLYMMLESFRFTCTSWGQLYEMFAGVMNYLPGPQHKAFKLLVGLEKYIEKKVKANEETLDPNSPRDFIDCFLIKMHQEKHNLSSEFFMKNIVLTVLTVFFAGTETVSTTLRYGFLILLKHPEIEGNSETQFWGYTIPQGTEVFALLGSALKDPEHFERPEAFDPGHFLDEMGQFKKNEAFLPFSIGKRFCFGDTLARMELFLFVTSILQHFRFESPIDRQDLDISPKLGTEVFALLGSVLKDPEHFERPEAFDPGHFLDDKGQFKKNEAFMPFSIGKRFCFGEMLAHMELFLFVTSILQHFRFESPIDRQALDISPRLMGFVSLPCSYQVCLIPPFPAPCHHRSPFSRNCGKWVGWNGMSFGAQHLLIFGSL